MRRLLSVTGACVLALGLLQCGPSRSSLPRNYADAACESMQRCDVAWDDAAETCEEGFKAYFLAFEDSLDPQWDPGSAEGAFEVGPYTFEPGFRNRDYGRYQRNGYRGEGVIESIEDAPCADLGDRLKLTRDGFWFWDPPRSEGCATPFVATVTVSR